MKLTMQIDRGGAFEYNLSQTSVIYLLETARRLEDDGDDGLPPVRPLSVPESDPAVAVGKNYPEMDKVAETGGFTRKAGPGVYMRTVGGKQEALVTGDSPEEVVKKAEAVTFKEEEPEEDFGELLKESEEKRKREWNDGQKSSGPPDGKYKGFLFLKCEKCGETRGFNAKVPIDEYRCDKCGGRTKLKDLRRMFIDCECGQHSRYYTNETAEVVTNNCINCGQPIDAMLNARRTAYVSIGGGSTRKNVGGYKRITTARYKW